MLPLSSPPDSICVLRLSAIGDVCHTLPVVRTLQAKWPQARITWIIGRTESRLLGDISDIEFITFDKARGWRAYADLARALRARRFDALLHMQHSMRGNGASLCVRARHRVGFDRARAKDWQWLFTNARIAPASGQHVMDGLFGFASALGATERVLRWDIPVPEVARAHARKLLPASHPTLVISPCANARFRNWRNWTYEGYAAVADHAANRGMRVVLTGGPSDEERGYGEAILARTEIPPINLIGRTDLKQLLAVFERATVVLSPDSGPAHMATAVGAPVISLFATTNPDRARPYLSAEWVVNRYPDAVRRHLGKAVEEVPFGTRVRDPAAMELITVEDVTRTLDRFLDAGAPRPGR